MEREAMYQKRIRHYGQTIVIHIVKKLFKNVKRLI